MIDTLHSALPRALRLTLLFAAELVLVMLAFQLFASLECRATSVEGACRALRGVGLRGVSVLVLLAVYFWAVRAAWQEFLRLAAARSGGTRWVALHVAGLMLIILPMALVPDHALNPLFHRILPLMVLGGGMAALGGLFWLAGPSDWRHWLRPRLVPVLALVLLAALLPNLAEAIGPIWYWETLTQITFAGVALMLALVADVPVVDPAAQIIGTNGFLVAVADSCSGVEGFVLVSAFLALYAVLFRDRLRLTRFWLCVWPVALLLSWLFNVIRITVLIMIGAYASPDLAVNGFHSFAGWLFFMLLAMAVLLVVDRIAWLRRVPGRDAPAIPLAEDALAARILPFVLFMVAGVLAQSFWADPILAYPWQALIMALSLWCFRVPLRAYLRRPSALALGAGVLVGLLWVKSAPSSYSPNTDALQTLSQAGLILWIAARCLGTTLLVPVIEELFFRSYLQARLTQGLTGPLGRPLAVLLAIAVSVGCFALLHDRWIMAAVAGFIFAALYHCRGRLSDAVAAHMVANLIIAIAAASTGNWALI